MTSHPHPLTLRPAILALAIFFAAAPIRAQHRPALSAVEQAQLTRDGMVVPQRLAYEDYTTAYYFIHRAQLPVFVSVDSIFHAIYKSHDQSAVHRA